MCRSCRHCVLNIADTMPSSFLLQRDVPGVHRGARGAAQRLRSLRGVVSGMRCNWRRQQLCKTALGGTRACGSCLKLNSH